MGRSESREITRYKFWHTKEERNKNRVRIIADDILRENVVDIKKSWR